MSMRRSVIETQILHSGIALENVGLSPLFNPFDFFVPYYSL